MKERPILFSGPMVRAILEGRKTMTRRVIKPQPTQYGPDDEDHYYPWMPIGGIFRDRWPCPYGQPGDKEWQTGMPPTSGYYYVKDFLSPEIDRPVWLNLCPKGTVPGIYEDFITWGFSPNDDPEAIESDDGPTLDTIQWKRPGDRLWVKETSLRFTGIPNCNKPWSEYTLSPDNDPYKARLPIVGNEDVVKLAHDSATGVKVPSIFMPRWASRILLEVTAVRVERVQSISEEDAEKEGLKASIDNITDGYFTIPARDFFEDLWDSINAKRGDGWDANPWVWVVEFRRIA
jgi:hypothetical protein